MKAQPGLSQHAACTSCAANMRSLLPLSSYIHTCVHNNHGCRCASLLTWLRARVIFFVVFASGLPAADTNGPRPTLVLLRMWLSWSPTTAMAMVKAKLGWRGVRLSR